MLTLRIHDVWNADKEALDQVKKRLITRAGLMIADQVNLDHEFEVTYKPFEFQNTNLPPWIQIVILELVIRQ
jgi:hypothetical protein